MLEPRGLKRDRDAAVDTCGPVADQELSLPRDFSAAFEVPEAACAPDGGGAAGASEPASEERNAAANARRTAQRQKQVDYGRNTLSYARYCELRPRHLRRRGDPQTPDVHSGVSKRAFDGLLREWRRGLHKWDEPADACVEQQPAPSEPPPPASAPTAAAPALAAVTPEPLVAAPAADCGDIFATAADDDLA